MNEQNAITFEQMLDMTGYLAYTVVGDSMQPLLRQGKDVVKLRKKGAERCSRFDVVLYKSEGRYFLSRIVRVRKSDYVLAGDNSLRRVRGVTDGQILAVLFGLVRGDREIKTTDEDYQRYVRRQCAFPLRAAARFCKLRFGTAGTMRETEIIA